MFASFTLFNIFTLYSRLFVPQFCFMDVNNIKKALEYFGIFTLSCSEKELKKKYFEKIKTLHPDVHSGESANLQNKYKSDFLKAHQQYQIASAFIKEVGEREYRQRSQQENTQHNNNKTFSNFSNFNNFSFYKKKKLSLSVDFIFSFFRCTFHKIQRRRFLSLEHRRHLLFGLPFFLYLFYTIYQENRNGKNNRNEQNGRNEKTEKLNGGTEKMDTTDIGRTSSGKENMGVTTKQKEDIVLGQENKRNIKGNRGDTIMTSTKVVSYKEGEQSKNKTKVLSKKRYIFNVVRRNKRNREDSHKIKDTRTNGKKKNSGNFHKVQYLKRDALMNATYLKEKTNSYFLFAPKQSTNIKYQNENIARNFSNVFKKITDLNTFYLSIRACAKDVGQNKKNSTTKNLEKKERKGEIERERETDALKKKKVLFKKRNLPLYEDFVMNTNNRGEHNESRYVNGIGGVCGGYILIKKHQEQNPKDDFFFKDLIYANKLKKKQFTEDAIKLQHLIIYEKAKYIDFCNPLKRVTHDEKINVRLNNELKYRNCVIPLKESDFEKRMHSLKHLENRNVKTVDQVIREAPEEDG